jgi:hypothetical protein
VFRKNNGSLGPLIPVRANEPEISVNLNLGSRSNAASGMVLAHLVARVALGAEGLSEAQSILSHAFVQFAVAPE